MLGFEGLRVCVLGSGYVGLTASVCFANFGHFVVCSDIDSARIDVLRSGRVPIFESGLSDLLASGLESGLLRFSDSVAESLADSDLVIVAVGTPLGEDGRVDLRALGAAMEMIVAHASEGIFVVIKSTVPPGTVERFSGILSSRRIGLIANPEFLREGCAVEDFMHPRRILVGVESSAAENIMRRLYAPLLPTYRFLVTTPQTAELAKYAANAMLAVRLSFINEIADLCAVVGGDLSVLRKALGLDERIGMAYLRAGPGYGGSCLPKDVSSLVEIGESRALPMLTVRAASEVNRHRVVGLVERIAVQTAIEGKRFALLGLAFKADTDDVRMSPSIVLARALRERGGELILHDPKGMANAVRVLVPDGFDDSNFAESAESALADVDVAVVLTEWQVYQALTAKDFQRHMRGDIVFDFRNLYSAGDFAACGLRYYDLGSL